MVLVSFTAYLKDHVNYVQILVWGGGGQSCLASQQYFGVEKDLGCGGFCWRNEDDVSPG